MKSRSAAVEGRFYPSTQSRIFDQIMDIEQSGRYPEPDLSPDTVYGAVLPHAGHLYSGYQTIPFFQLLRRHRLFPETFVIVHPNHSGVGSPLSVDEAESWSNSIGEVPVDVELARAMKLPFDKRAHMREHSAEVIIPFIQYFLAGHPFSIVPVCMMDQSYKNALYVAERIIKASVKTGRKIILIASCDFSHFLPPAEGMKMDQLLLDQILMQNAKGVERAVIEYRISACGYGPIMTLMEYAGTLNPNYRIEVLARGHSGEVNASPEVVDYISLIAYR
jgi:AmmeMemoRadiSam system protein B